MTRLKSTILALVAVLMSPIAANADLIGQDITVEWLFPDDSTLFAADTVTVGAGAEISCPGAFNLCSGFVVDADIDIGANVITLLVTGGSSAWTATSFNGYSFSDLSLGGLWDSYILDTNFSGLDASRVTFDGSELLVNMQGLAANEGDYFTFTLVPEPGTLALLGIGLLGMGAARRKKA